MNILLKTLGIGGIIADSFAENIYTRATTRAYPLVLECPGISRKVSRWDLLEVDFKTGLVKNLTEEMNLQPSRVSGRVRLHPCWTQSTCPY